MRRHPCPMRHRLDDPLERELETWRAAGLQRVLRVVDSAQGARIVWDGREYLNFSSNDYLALANDPVLKRAALAAIESFGLGAGASRLVCGNLRPYRELEDALARFKHQPAALVFGSGYAANVGVISALVERGDVVVLDKRDHASIIDGARQSGATIRVYPHGNMGKLERILESVTGTTPGQADTAIQTTGTTNRQRRVLIVTETVFSMDGDLAPLAEVVALKEKYGAWLMIDEAHATGLYGPGRRGLAEALGLEDKIEVTLGTLSKAFGCAGGYVAGSETLIEYLRHRARSLVYSTALPPAVVAAALAAVEFVMGAAGQERRDRLWRQVSEMKLGLSAMGYANQSRSAIIPIVVGDETKAVELSRALMERGIFAPAIRYPTVSRGQARLRVTVTAGHSREDIRQFFDALALATRAGRAAPPVARAIPEKPVTTPELAAVDRRHVWHPFTQMRDWMREPPVIIESGRGAYLRDVEGREYLDANASIWTNLHGHCHPVITAAIKEQLDRIAHSSFLGLSNVPAIRLAEKLAALTGLERVFYSDDGSTAMEAAIKMALQYWRHRGEPQRTKFVSFTEAYHGDTMGAVSVGGIRLFHETFRALTFDVIRVDNAEELARVEGGTVAAVCIEPVIQGAAGMRLWPRGLLREVRRWCDEQGALLIADEVMTGFGRTGTMFACEQESVRPDVMALAKGLSGGYLPVAATMATEEVFKAFLGGYEEFKTFFHGHSYTGNQLGCAAALASLRVFEEEKTLERIGKAMPVLAEGLDRCRHLKMVADVRQCGLIGAVEIDPYPVEAQMGIKVCRAMRERGVLTRPILNTIVLMPPYCLTDAEIRQICQILEESIRVVTQT